VGTEKTGTVCPDEESVAHRQAITSVRFTCSISNEVSLISTGTYTKRLSGTIRFTGVDGSPEGSGAELENGGCLLDSERGVANLAAGSIGRATGVKKVAASKEAE